jgi:hypothetical protein
MLEGTDRQVRWESVPLKTLLAKFKQQRELAGVALRLGLPGVH